MIQRTDMKNWRQNKFCAERIVHRFGGLPAFQWTGCNAILHRLHHIIQLTPHLINVAKKIRHIRYFVHKI